MRNIRHWGILRHQFNTFTYSLRHCGILQCTQFCTIIYFTKALEYYNVISSVQSPISLRHCGILQWNQLSTFTCQVWKKWCLVFDQNSFLQKSWHCWWCISPLAAAWGSCLWLPISQCPLVQQRGLVDLLAQIFSENIAASQYPQCL